VLPSLPVNITCVAFVAVTVKVEELPGAIEARLAVMTAVGAAEVALNWALPPQPASSMSSKKQGITESRTLLKDWRIVDLFKVSSFLFSLRQLG